MAYMALVLLLIFIAIMLLGIPVGFGMGALTVIAFELLGGDRNRNPERGRCSGCKTLLCTGGDDRRGQCQRSADRREGTVGDPFTGGEGML